MLRNINTISDLVRSSVNEVITRGLKTAYIGDIIKTNKESNKDSYIRFRLNNIEKEKWQTPVGK